MSGRRSIAVSLKIKHDGISILGPGKIDLLERIDRLGSISAAARDMGMSYRRAWLLVSHLKESFGKPVVETSHGGKSGGGARLTPLGAKILDLYRVMEDKARQATTAEVAELERLLADN